MSANDPLDVLRRALVEEDDLRLPSREEVDEALAAVSVLEQAAAEAETEIGDLRAQVSVQAGERLAAERRADQAERERVEMAVELGYESEARVAAAARADALTRERSDALVIANEIEEYLLKLPGATGNLICEQILHRVLALRAALAADPTGDTE